MPDQFRERVSCFTCKYWQADNDDYGRCRHSPPAIFIDNEGIKQTSWPTTKPDDWCGKWQYDSPYPGCFDDAA